MNKKMIFYFQLSFTLFICAFLILPVFMSIMAGLTSNYFVGLKSGLTFRWVLEVWALYSETIWLTMMIALVTTFINVVIGFPCAYVLTKYTNRFTALFDEILTLPIAIPGMSIGLGLLSLYGGWSSFRSHWTFILVGHVIFTLPFMIKAITSVMKSINMKDFEEGAASLGASLWQRLLGVILPNCKPGIIAGMLISFTLSIGEFNLTWMLHTPLTKTLPVGLADSYASMRLEISSAYTLIFLFLILPLLIIAYMINNKITTKG